MSSTQTTSMTADIKAGLVVFLIALPLSIGISIASGAPTTAGLISAVLGGLVGAYLGGSHVTINGPAAGLIVVVLSAIQSLSHGDTAMGFKRLLACVVIVGILQILSGLLKVGRFVALFPASVVHGMLSSIGLIIIIKQFHVFLGHKAQGSIIDSIIQIPQSVFNLNPEAAIIGLVAIVLLLIYPHIKISLTKIIPAPLVVVVVGTILAASFKNVSLVTIPSKFSEFFISPSFDLIWSNESLMAIFSLYFVASLESILSASAVDKLDPLKRESNFDRELWSKGLVNLSCGIVGGLPIIAEIVRSSASISQGAKTPMANFSHGAFMLLFLMFFPRYLNMIPLPALAAILILVGYRLAQPKQFMEMKNLGPSALSAFTATIVVTLAVDLLAGIFAGIAVKALVSLILGAKLSSFLTPSYRMRNEGDKAILEFDGALVFFSALKQKDIFNRLRTFNSIEINLSNIDYIDPTSLGMLSRTSLELEGRGALVVIKMPEKFKKIFQQMKNH